MLRRGTRRKIGSFKEESTKSSIILYKIEKFDLLLSYMNRLRLTAKELQHHYRQGKRDFTGVDLSGESLRGMNLQDIDLSEADLSCTDIRGTRFINASLKNTVFNQANAGIQRRWLIYQIVSTLVISQIFGLLSTILNSLTFINLFTSSGRTINAGLVALTIISSMLLSITFRGTTFKALRSISYSIIIIFLVVFVVASTGGLMGAGLVFGGALGALTTAATVADSILVTVAVVSISGVRGVLVGLALLTLSLSPSNTPTGMLNNIAAILSLYMTWRALAGDSKFAFLRETTLAIGIVGGTSFSGANLTGAYFTQANLKNTNFSNSRKLATNLNSVRWHNVRKLDHAHVGNSVLKNPKVRDLLVTLNGTDQDFSDMNLRGANLSGANLARADLSGVILNEAILNEANLQAANLTEASCISVNFSQADFTGATLEAWNIDSTTNLNNARCDYVYLMRGHHERRPNSGIFGSGEFTKLFQEVLNTVDLIFRNGVDWKTFVQTLNTIQVEHAGDNIAIQAIENKGDGVVVVKLKATPIADKEAIHRSFMQRYQKALKAVDRQYKKLLQAKDSEIQSYRRENSNMYTIAKTLAQRELIHMENNFFHGDDRTINISGDATGNVFQSGDSSTANVEFQQVKLPSSESVNIQSELLALHRILTSFQDPVTDGIAQKLKAEAQKPNPDKSIVTQTLETGLSYAKNLQGFAESIDKLRPHVKNAAGWLGKHGYKLLSLVGLAL